MSNEVLTILLLACIAALYIWRCKKWQSDWRFLHRKYAELVNKTDKAKADTRCHRCGHTRIGFFCARCGDNRLKQLPAGSEFVGLEDGEPVFFIPGREAELKKHYESAAFCPAYPSISKSEPRLIGNLPDGEFLMFWPGSKPKAPWMTVEEMRV